VVLIGERQQFFEALLIKLQGWENPTRSVNKSSPPILPTEAPRLCSSSDFLLPFIVEDFSLLQDSADSADKMSFGGQTPTIIVLKEGKAIPAEVLSILSCRV
jgi:hypothetical protein